MAAATKTQSEQFATAQQELAEAAQSQFIASVKAQQKVALDAATSGPSRYGKLYPVPATYAAEVREQAKKTNAVYDELLAAQRVRQPSPRRPRPRQLTTPDVIRSPPRGLRMIVRRSTSAIAGMFRRTAVRPDDQAHVTGREPAAPSCPSSRPAPAVGRRPPAA